jgi:phospholipase/carboxylesterase
LRSHLPGAFTYAAVRAPLDPPFPMSGYSWYPIEGLESRDPAGVTAGARALLEWVASSGARRVGLVGFSQGAAVSLQAMRLAPERFDFVVNLSGYAAGGTAPGDETLKTTGVPVFWGRGAADEVIPPEAIEHTTTWLPDHSELVGRVYPGLGHAVGQQEIADLRRFLEKQLS